VSSVADYQQLLPEPRVLERLAVSESGFIFDPFSGHSFTVNETGLEILRSLQQDRDLSTLQDRLADEYDVDRMTIDRDMLEFLGSLRDQLLRT
jgi:hypothetical protein